MNYTVWSHGQLIGTTVLPSRPADIPYCVGWFVPNDDGEKLTPLITARAFALREYRLHQLQNKAQAGSMPVSDRLAFCATIDAAYERVQALEPELRGENGVKIVTADISLRDTDITLPKSLDDLTCDNLELTDGHEWRDVGTDYAVNEDTNDIDADYETIALDLCDAFGQPQLPWNDRGGVATCEALPESDGATMRGRYQILVLFAPLVTDLEI